MIVFDQLLPSQPESASKESPVGKAVLGHKVGDRVTVQVNENYSYDIVIRAVEKGQDDASLPISSY